jgi:hypothetical protein
VKTIVLTAAIILAPVTAWAWGQEGHSIIAEIAQRRLTPQAAAAVDGVLGHGRSLASIASWADDYREQAPATEPWHFVDIPVDATQYDPATECAGDSCVIARLDILKSDVRCATDPDKMNALRFAVHFVGDVHQPLHTVAEERGGNGIEVELFMRGLTCTGRCQPAHVSINLHAAWDGGLIDKAVWSWGAYVERLEDGWLRSPEAVGADAGTPLQWAMETHAAAPIAWHAVPANKVLDDGYFNLALPILDRQLGRAGLRLARFLNEAYGSTQCPVR